MTDSNNATTYEIPQKCKAGVVVNEGPDFHVEVQEVDVPEIGPEDVLIKMNCTGICHSDLHFMLADWGIGKMSDFGTRCAGHEGAGVIVKIGANVKTLKVGQRAGFKPIADTCGNWTYKQYVKSPERYTTTIPDGVSDYVAGPIMCSASTIYTSLKASGLRPGNWAVFPGGGGGVGIQGVQLAEAMGYRPIVIDTGSEREAMVKELGAEHFVDFKTSADVAKEIVELTDGIGAHAVFVTAPQSYGAALSYLGTRVGGTVMCIGLPTAGTNNMTIAPAQVIFRNQGIRGTLVSNMADVDETLDFAKRGKLRLQPTVVGLSKFNESCQALKNGKVAGRIVVDFNME
ncbi:hypothetical protein BLS_002435 [Venturia inaequalis]|uniref:Enoyl reductase (ER) domain-containing protein n=1 Tax=Venturia inaequalis TaxID=5025 RepID=A0A8H3VAL1_VENIN|nr:hypothetical protein EG328_009188 [Venturia inaequalis]KAE9984405.1 hypothetical protein BLS_002435 [Venturia inaequalis]